eukprot:278280-Rhodomonas_salina.1
MGGQHAPEASFGAVVGALIAKIEAQQAILRAVFPAHPPDILLSLFQTALQVHHLKPDAARRCYHGVVSRWRQALGQGCGRLV